MRNKKYVVEDFSEEAEDENDFVHETKKKFDWAIERIDKSEFNNKNKQLIREFADYLDADKRLTYCRIGDHTTRLIKFFRDLIPKVVGDKPADKIDKGEMQKIERKIRRTRWSEWTKVNYLVSIKLFWRWMHLVGKTEEDVADWIETKHPESNNLSPNDLFTREEVMAMRDAASCFRDRAMVHVLYDSGMRIGELLRLTIRDVYFDKYGAKVTVSKDISKSPFTRYVRIINSVRDLKNWLEFHPNKDDPEAYLFVKVGEPGAGEPMNYDTAAKQLKKLAKRAGVKKRVTPHLFRHTRATELASKMNEYSMCNHFGWKIGSDMPSVYIHLSGKSVEDAILEFHGLKTDDDRESDSNPVKCPVCQETNPADALFCMKCGKPLREDATENLILQESGGIDNPELSSVVERMFMQWAKQNPQLLEEVKQQVEAERS